MTTPETPEAILHPTEPLWAANVEEDPREGTLRQAHLIVRVAPNEFHGLRTRCGHALGGVMSSIRTWFNEPPSDVEVCDACGAVADEDVRTE